MFTFTDQCGTRENDGQHGDLIDNFHDGSEPGLLERRIKAHPYHKVHGRDIVGSNPLEKSGDFPQDNLLNVAGAGKRLAHARRVDIELDVGRLACQHITLEVWWNIQGKSNSAFVHAGVHFFGRSHRDRFEQGRVERRDNARRQC